MKITAIKLYRVSLPMKEGSYSWSNQSFDAFDSTVVAIETDEGLTGVGEICPLGQPICRPMPRARVPGSPLWHRG